MTMWLPPSSVNDCIAVQWKGAQRRADMPVKHHTGHSYKFPPTMSLQQRLPASTRCRVLHVTSRHCPPVVTLRVQLPCSHGLTRSRCQGRLRLTTLAALQTPEDLPQQRTGVLCQIPSTINPCVHVLQVGTCPHICTSRYYACP